MARQKQLKPTAKKSSCPFHLRQILETKRSQSKCSQSSTNSQVKSLDKKPKKRTGPLPTPKNRNVTIQTARKSTGGRKPGPRSMTGIGIGRGKTPAMINAERYRPGEYALRDIRKYQASTELLIKKMPFQRLVREILQNRYPTTFRVQTTALLAMQVSMI